MNFLLSFFFSLGLDNCASCTENAELDFFRAYTSIAKQRELVSMPLNEAPRTPGSDRNEPSFEFAGTHWLEDSGSRTLNAVMCGVCSRHEVTFHASLLFLSGDEGGPLVQLSHELSPIFSVNVNSKGNSISIYYSHQDKFVVEKLPVQLSIGR